MTDSAPASDHAAAAVDPSLDGSPGEASGQPAAAQSGVAHSTYELLRSRLSAAAADLAGRASALNQQRLESFGSSSLELLATERVRTDANAIPRDVVTVGDQLILGYNVAAGIKSEIRAEDVFAVHHLEVGESPQQITFSPNPEGLRSSALDDDQFHRDFDELHTYFKEAKLQQLYRSAHRLLAVFRTGGGTNDIRVLRWQIETDNTLRYLDARGERDHRFPPNQDVDWTLTTRADHVGASHVAIGARVLVNPIGGSLEIRLDDGGAGTLLFSDRLDHADQSLQDCQIRWAKAGDLVLLDVLPYGENEHRYYVVNLLVKSALRLDALGEAFRQLPDGQGMIFPEGVYLKTGELRTFDLDVSGMELLEVVRSPNGEDVLYIFYEQASGRSILLPYNVVRQEVSLPIWCHGHTMFEDGTMVVFREEPEPTRIHPLQIWATPYCSDEWYTAQPRGESKFDRIGNASLVSGIADALGLARLVEDVEPSTEVYADLLASAGRFVDAHFWASDDVVGNLVAPADDIRTVAEQVIDEFERLQEVRASAGASLAEAEADVSRVLEDLRLNPPSTTEAYIDGLAEIRRNIGHLHSVRERREINVERVDELIARAQSAHNDLAQGAAAHLSTDGAFEPYHRLLSDLATRTPVAASSVEANELLAEVDSVAESMDLVAGTVSDLVVEDPRVRTSVLEQVSGVLAELNRVRAGVEGKREELVQSETGAAFSTELGLFGQSIAAAIGRADTPEACDDALARLLLQLEQLETAGPRTDAQLDELTQRRDQVTEALAGRRQQLVDERQQKAERLISAADRTLTRVVERAEVLPGVDDVNGFFAADPMVGRVRKLVEDLRALGEPVRADELQSRLGAARDNAARAIRDRQDLFDGDAVKLGRFKFSVDDRTRELTIVPSERQLEVVLTGTDLRLPIRSEELERHRDLWRQALLSENQHLYRATFLAANLVLDMVHGTDGAGLGPALAADGDEAVLAIVRGAADKRLDEGYDRGVHDLDAANLAMVIGRTALAADTLVTGGIARARAQLVWAHEFDDDERNLWLDRGAAGAALEIDLTTIGRFAEELAERVDDTVLARYLMAELTRVGGLAFAHTSRVAEVVAEVDSRQQVSDLRAEMTEDLAGAQVVLSDYVARLVGADEQHLVAEVVAHLLTPDLPRRQVEIENQFTVAGLNGRHPTIAGGELSGRVDEVLDSVERYLLDVVPAHRQFGRARREALTQIRTSLRVDDLEPRVPEGFVRNRLIDQVYLPLIGDNLARQIGTVDDRAGARSGLLMLLSPPGYGKTLLVEYLADRLGMALVKVSGPGLGHDVTSLDPAQAPSATAAREIERINLSFAVGTNVILYLDDIQHTNPEFLQRFIALCDAQRRVEGVWNGESTSFDLRGKRFAVVMAGNPYTESGERFRVPDMLANRADTYNLGDVLDGNADLFARSYLENALSSNPVLAPLVGIDPADLDLFFLAAGGAPLDESALKQSMSSAEVNEIVSTLRHLRQVQEVVLMVNRQYIASAASADAYRTEPPFLLQGSYRNMARMTSKLLPAMTVAEVDEIINEHYVAESQALTGAAEANLLKLAQLRGTMMEAQQSRWDDILRTFNRQQRMGGDERDPATRVVAAIENVVEALHSGAGERAKESSVPAPVITVNVPPAEPPPVHVTVEGPVAPVAADNSAATEQIVAAIERVAEVLGAADPVAARAVDLLASDAAARRAEAASPSKVGRAIPPRPGGSGPSGSVPQSQYEKYYERERHSFPKRPSPPLPPTPLPPTPRPATPRPATPRPPNAPPATPPESD